MSSPTGVRDRITCNGFASCADPAGLQAFCDRFGLPNPQYPYTRSLLDSAVELTSQEQKK
jgi:hypothetical protein